MNFKGMEVSTPKVTDARCAANKAFSENPSPENRTKLDDACARLQTPLLAGDVLVYLWGYGQTNVDFYRVTRATAKTAWIRHMSSVRNPDLGLSMTYTAVPDFNGPLGEEKRRKIYDRDGTPILYMAYGVARLWDGEPQHGSSYA